MAGREDVGNRPSLGLFQEIIARNYSECPRDTVCEPVITSFTAQNLRKNPCILLILLLLSYPAV